MAKSEKELKKEIKQLKKTCEMLSNQKVVKGLLSALEDVKKGDYIVLTN